MSPRLCVPQPRAQCISGELSLTCPRVTLTPPPYIILKTEIHPLSLFHPPAHPHRKLSWKPRGCLVLKHQPTCSPTVQQCPYLKPPSLKQGGHSRTQRVLLGHHSSQAWKAGSSLKRPKRPAEKREHLSAKLLFVLHGITV